MKRALIVCLAALALSSSGACVDLKPGRCNGDSDCPAGTRCDLAPTPQGNGRCVAKSIDGGDAAPAADADGGVEVPADGPSDQAEAEAPVACTAASCTGTAPICDGTSKACRSCAPGAECTARNAATPVCAASGACVECGTSSQCGGADKPICDMTSNACRACGTGAECATRDATTPACASSGKCVACVANTDCKTANKPICNTTANTCRPCKTDSECPADPGVCMEDGHCATTAEVIFVEFKTAGCPSADGTSAKPYCAPNEGVAALSSERHVIVIRGAANDKMSLATTGKNPVVIGRKNAAGIVGAIPAGATIALTVSSDEVLVRDLVVAGGLGSAQGVVVTGAPAKLTLRRVTVDLGAGLGIDAEAGASLTMEGCVVQNNSGGGVYINGAGYNIQNSVMADNGDGIQFTALPVTGGSQFSFNTVKEATASICHPSSAQVLRDSIVVGTNVSCTLTNCATTATPPFSGPKSFHLTTHLACPAAPATFPDHDIDGDPRVAPIDCGADQYVP